MDSLTLARTVSVRQSSMAATGLPLELQQQIFSFLDTKSFYTARNVCRYWRFASIDTVVLERQLRKLPILPQANARKSEPQELMDLFDEAAQTLMLGMQVLRKADTLGSMAVSNKHGFQATPRVCSTSNGNRTVTLNERTIALFDTSRTPARLISHRPINDLKETIGNGPWLKIAPASNHDLALSSDGSLLAIAQERTIQIYDLLSDPDSFTVNEYIASASGHYICGLAFEQNDHVLRVQLSGRGTVLYCGTPPAEGKNSGKASLEHWKSTSGLKHTFLDSHILNSRATEPDLDESARLSGLQLLRSFQNGYLFAAQRHGGGQSSHYVLGHVRASVPHNTPAQTVEPDSVTILAKLESFLSSWDYTLNCSAGSDNTLGLWENMPSAHEHHPGFTMSPDNSLLVLAEKDKKQIRPLPLTQIFVYRLPTAKQMSATLAARQAQKNGKWASLAGFLDRLEASQGAVGKGRISMKHEDFEVTSAKEKITYKVGRVPLCLSTVQGALTSMKFAEAVDDDEEEGVRHVLSVSTAHTTRNWSLLEL